MASLSRPGARFSTMGFLPGSLRAIVDCVLVGSASALGFDGGGAVASLGCSGCGCGREASAMVLSGVLPRERIVVPGQHGALDRLGLVRLVGEIFRPLRRTLPFHLRLGEYELHRLAHRLDLLALLLERLQPRGLGGLHER